MSYRLTLTPDDWRALDFIGGRYSWSDALYRICRHSCAESCPDVDSCMSREDNTHTFYIPEYLAWELAEAFEADTEGGHSPFPMLDPRSELYAKLTRFWDSII